MGGEGSSRWGVPGVPIVWQYSFPTDGLKGKEYAKYYYQRHRARILARRKRKYKKESNRLKLAKMRLYWLKNRDRLNAKRRKGEVNHSEKYLAKKEKELKYKLHAYEFEATTGRSYKKYISSPNRGIRKGTGVRGRPTKAETRGLIPGEYGTAYRDKRFRRFIKKLGLDDKAPR